MHAIENPAAEPPLPIVVVGHVDHGKSTVIGRLLHDTGNLADARRAEAAAASARRGDVLEWSYVLDALQVERDQGITLDTSFIWFRTARRGYVIIDAPGHKEFLRNMVTGATSADAALLVVDAAQGVSEQTRRHSYMLALLGIRQVTVLVNKMDLVGFAHDRFVAVEADIRAYLAGIGIVPQAVLPLSARHGDNVAGSSPQLAWWHGPTLVDALDAFERRPLPVNRPLRLPVQDVYRDGDRRVIVGRIESGRLKVGETVRFAPGGQTARVVSIDTGRGPTSAVAVAGQSVALTLDQPLFVERGAVASPPGATPAETNLLRVRLFWLNREPLRVGDRLTLKVATAAHAVTVEAIERVIDVQDLGQRHAAEMNTNDVGEVLLRSRSRVALDGVAVAAATSRGVLVRDYRLVGGCLFDHAGGSAAERNISAVVHSVTAEERSASNGHAGGVLWLTGLSGAGKSTLAMLLQRRLFERGYQVFVLDGDNLRHGLNRDLGFSPADRDENVRRTAEAARLFADAGMIVVTALISPLAAGRRLAREVVGAGFREIYVRAGLAECERRDTKGLYARARAGQIKEFTGISAPFEEPDAPDLLIDTERDPVEFAVGRLIELVDRDFAASRQRRPATA